MSEAEAQCSVCFGPVRTMAYKGTGVCGGKCEEVRKSHQDTLPGRAQAIQQQIDAEVEGLNALARKAMTVSKRRLPWRRK